LPSVDKGETLFLEESLRLTVLAVLALQDELVGAGIDMDPELLE
jgi:hypothetical protein